jgi:nucleoside-diphosphate-sugar epimerase
MVLSFERVAVVGATGPTGREIATQLAAKGLRVRVVSRRAEVLETMFAGVGVEKRTGDALDADSLLAAIADCDLVIDCIGLPSDHMADHPKVAATLAAAIGRTGARCVQVSSYWSFMPIGHVPVSEKSARADGPPWARYRRQAEDILCEAGGAIVHLPDFFGPYVHSSTLQLPLMDAIAGKSMNWIGGADVERDYIYVPDAMKLVADLATHNEAYGERWVIPGSGPISGSQVAAMLSSILGRQVKLRTAGPLLLRALSLFKPDLRGLMQVVPTYVQPIRYDGSKLDQLLGKRQRTPYERAFRQTLSAIAAS